MHLGKTLDFKDEHELDRYYRVDLYERKKKIHNFPPFSAAASGSVKWRFSNFPRFRESESSSEPLNGIFENNLLQRLTEQNMKKSEISRLSSHSRFLVKLPLKVLFPAHSSHLCCVERLLGVLCTCLCSKEQAISG